MVVLHPNLASLCRTGGLDPIAAEVAITAVLAHSATDEVITIDDLANFYTEFTEVPADT